VIDRLLASPQYGERWGRHWLDVVRYADTAGCNSDFPVPDLYRYRNWVIQSFNSDKPYLDFLREQIAGDLMKPVNDEDRQAKIIATSYIALSRRFASSKNEHHLTIDDTLDNIGKGMLGLSISCAHCHDHKFDAIRSAIISLCTASSNRRCMRSPAWKRRRGLTISSRSAVRRSRSSSRPGGPGQRRLRKDPRVSLQRREE